MNIEPTYATASALLRPKRLREGAAGRQGISNIEVRKLRHSLIVILYSIFLTSCANIVPPSGGPKDTEPPQVVKSVPANRSVNFSSKTAVITFNEYIRLNQVQDKLIVSPPMAEKPEVRVKKKSLWIVFKGEMEPNTTYTLNFGDAITDITENNAAGTFQYVFSTGPHLDSLTVQGRVADAFTGKTEKGIVVMLYAGTDDSLPYREKPRYFTRCGEDGGFVISNVKEGDYKIFALKDGNGNYLYDQPAEMIAFADSLLALPDSARIPLSLFTEDDPKQALLDASMKQFGRVRFVFRRPVEGFRVRTLNHNFKKAWHIEERSATNDTITWWLTDIAADTLVLEVSDDGRVLDTVTIAVIKPETLRPQERVLPVVVNAHAALPFDMDQALTIEAYHPLKDFLSDSIMLFSGGVQLPVSIYADSATGRRFRIVHRWEEETEYRLYIAGGAFTDIFGFVNDTMDVTLKIRPYSYYGKLSLNLTLPAAQHPYILQLLNDKDKTVRELIVHESQTAVFDHLHPQEYRLQLIADSNGNGRWDTGIYRKGLQPEKVTYYPGRLNVRSNWEMEAEWGVE